MIRILKIIAFCFLLCLANCPCTKTDSRSIRTNIVIDSNLKEKFSKDIVDKIKNSVADAIQKEESMIHYLTPISSSQLSFIMKGYTINDNYKSLLRAQIILTVLAENKKKTFKAKINLTMKDNSNLIDELDIVLPKLIRTLVLKQRLDKKGISDPISLIKQSQRGNEVPSEDLLDALAATTIIKNKDIKKHLVKLLKGCDDLAVCNATMFALSDYEGDDEAMRAIIEFAERKTPIVRRQAVIAAKRIGSRLAAAWLLVMAYGHTDEQVRAEAYEALQVVDKKLKKKE